MRRFSFVRPEKLQDVLALKQELGPDASLLAGGTDLIVRLRMGHIRPITVVDLKKVRELRSGIVETDGALRIGALTSMTALIRDARVAALFPALVQAASVVGSVQIRNRATLAGNICNASPAADTAPPLLVYRAAVNIAGLAGCRTVPLADFFTGPGRTVLARDEIVESIDLPLPAPGLRAAFGRVTRRRGVDLATINLCCATDDSGGVRLACGALAPRPFLAEAPALEAALERALAQASPISDVRGSREYRLAMLPVMTRRLIAGLT